MKKSKAFYWAQIATLRCDDLTYEEKLEIVAVLMDAEGTAKFSEKLKEDKQNGESV